MKTIKRIIRLWSIMLKIYKKEVDDIYIIVKKIEELENKIEDLQNIVEGCRETIKFLKISEYIDEKQKTIKNKYSEVPDGVRDFLFNL